MKNRLIANLNTRTRRLALLAVSLVVCCGAGLSPASLAQIPARPVNASPELLADLKHTNPIKRRAAANQIAALRARNALSGLITALLDKDASVREAAAFALGQMTEPRAVPHLLKALQDKEEEVRASAAFALGMIGDHKAITALSNALAEDSIAVRSNALVALGLMQDFEGIEEFVDALNDASIDVRYDAVWAIGQIDDPEAIDHLYAALVNLDLVNIDDAFLEGYRQVVQNSLERLKAREQLIASRSRPRRATSASAPVPTEMSRANRPLSVLQSVQAAATERALRARITGAVELRALVGADGYAVRAYVTKRLGYGLDQRAMQAVMQYKFNPELRDGLPQTTWVNLEVKF